MNSENFLLYILPQAVILDEFSFYFTAFFVIVLSIPKLMQNYSFPSLIIQAKSK